MNPAERWSRVTELFGGVYEMSGERRRRALEAIDDAELRGEVEALLVTHDRLTREEDGFLAALDPRFADALLDRSAGSAGGEFIGRYRIVRELGRGGMGIVYEAHDPVLDRPVALKLLPAYMGADPAAIRRLGAEARAASALDHPQIQTVYEIGETAGGRAFIALACYDGETLRTRIDRGPMAVGEVVELGTQLVAGLGAAHRAGIVHRDIKPENLLVTREGVLKILDFGIAKLARDATATSGRPRGSAAYMSPEQTRGEPVDARTDLWSAGVVLYEMLAGARPFLGQGVALLHAIRHDSHTSLREARSDAPPELAATIDRCLEKERERRPESADILLLALRGARAGRSAESPARRRARSRRGLAGVAVAAALALAIAVFLVGRRHGNPPLVEGEHATPAVAVLPFEVRGEGLTIWGEGMADLLSIGLGEGSSVRAIDSRTVIGRWRGRQRSGEALDLETALEIAREAGAGYAVVGSVISRGRDLRLGARIYSTEGGGRLAALQVEGSPDSLFALADRLSIGLLASIWQGREQPQRDVDLSRITTVSLPALIAFLEGESHIRRAEYPAAVAAYEWAVEADSTFAYALYHLGLAYGWIGDAPRERAAYERALRHAGRLPQREALLFRATYSYGKASGLFTTIGLLEEATRRYPDDVDAWYFLGDRYWHDGRELLVGQVASERAFRKVVELDPGYAPGYAHLVNNAFTIRPDSVHAGRLVEINHRLAPKSRHDQLSQIAFGLAFGDRAHRDSALAAYDTLPVGDQWWITEGYFDHPRFWGLAVDVLERVPRSKEFPLVTAALFDADLSLGRLRDALAILEEPTSPRTLRSVALYRIHSAGLPPPGVDLDEALAPSPRDSDYHGFPAILSAFYEGAYSAERGRWTEYAAALGRLRTKSEEYVTAGDSVRARFGAGVAAALEGKAARERGEADLALEFLRSGQRWTAGSGSESMRAVNQTIRWWIGDLLQGTGKPREAIPWFESLWNDPLAAERLAPLYERIGETEKAREAWTLVVAAWRDADPEFQDRARSASAALRRLELASRE